jgi:peptidoglycan/LPS O-acetylase OafA/YrhL
VPASGADHGRGLRYLPGLDGLRALSLIAILLYHSAFPWARGGFLGVTVFFTLSGFLITSLLVREREATGAIRLRKFWQRRAQRLAPGVLVLFAVVAAMLFTGSIAHSGGIAGDAAATATWVANWRFVASGQSYAAIFSAPSPFQHMWSLAIEEQFYLLLPGLLLLCLGRKAKTRRWVLALVLLAAAAASTWVCAAMFGHGSTTRSYFGTDARVAEPLVGALLALALLGRLGLRELKRWVTGLADVLAVGALVGLGLLMHGLGQYDSHLYRGGFLLTALLTAFVITAASQQRSLVGRALSIPPLVWLGRISYGGYLYHWPVFLWLTQRRTGLSTWPLLSLRVVATVALATASYLAIEQPVRRARRIGIPVLVTGWATASVSLVGSVVVAATAVPALVSVSDAIPDTAPPLPAVVAGPAAPGVIARPQPRKPGTPKPSATSPTAVATTGPTARPVTRVPGSSPSSPTTTHAPVTKPTKAPGPPPPPPPPQLRIAVVGDSLADNLGAGMIAWAKGRKDVVVYNLSIPGCPIAPGGTRRFPDGYEHDVSATCAWWTKPSDQRSVNLAKFNPDILVMEDALNEMVDRKLPSWATYESPGDPLYDNWLLGQYKQALKAMNPQGHAKVIMLNAVCGNWNTETMQHFQGSDAESAKRIDSLNSDYASMSGVSLEDLDGHLCPGGQFTDTIDGVNNARQDGYHLTDAAALAVATRWLGPIVLKAAPA